MNTDCGSEKVVKSDPGDSWQGRGCGAGALVSSEQLNLVLCPLEEDSR